MPGPYVRWQLVPGWQTSAVGANRTPKRPGRIGCTSIVTLLDTYEAGRKVRALAEDQLSLPKCWDDMKDSGRLESFPRGKKKRKWRKIRI